MHWLRVWWSVVTTVKHVMPKAIVPWCNAEWQHYQNIKPGHWSMLITQAENKWERNWQECLFSANRELFVSFVSGVSISPGYMVIHLCCALNRFTWIAAMLSKSTCKLPKISNPQVTACDLCFRLCLRLVSTQFFNFRPLMLSIKS